MPDTLSRPYAYDPHDEEDVLALVQTQWVCIIHQPARLRGE